MRKKLSITAAIFLVLLIAGLAMFWPRDQGPLYKGKSVAYWMAHPETNAAAGRVGVGATIGGAGRGRVLIFPDFDSNAVPYMVRALETKDSRSKTAYMTIREKSPLWVRRIAPELVPAQTIKRNAVLALGQMGRAAKPAIPALVRVAREDDIVCSIAAVINLEHIGPRDEDVRKALIQLANSTNTAVAKFANDALHREDYQAPLRSATR